MCGLNGSEFLIIVVVAVIVLGPDRLPELMRLLGRGAREVRNVTRGIADVQREIKSKVSVDELRKKIREELILEEKEASAKRDQMQSEADAVRARKAARLAQGTTAPSGPATTDAASAAQPVANAEIAAHATAGAPSTDAAPDAPLAASAGVDDEAPLPAPPVVVRPAAHAAATSRVPAPSHDEGGEG